MTFPRSARLDTLAIAASAAILCAALLTSTGAEAFTPKFGLGGPRPVSTIVAMSSGALRVGARRIDVALIRPRRMLNRGLKVGAGLIARGRAIAAEVQPFLP